MEKNTLLKLHKTFFVVALLSLLSGVILVFMEVYDFSMGATSDISSFRFFGKSNFSLIQGCLFIFSTTATTFCAFLVSGIFQYLAHKENAQLERATKFKNVCCTAYLLQGIFVILNFATKLPHSLSAPCMRFECNNILLSFTLYFSVILQFLSEVSPPFLLAISIYVLFKHFANLLTFESEVA